MEPMRTVPFALAMTAIMLVSLFTFPSAHAVSYGDVGSKVEVDDSDFVPTLTTTLPAGFTAQLVSRTVGTDTFYYLHFNSGGDTAIESGQTYRVTCGVAFTSSCPTDEKEKTWVESGDDDLAQPTFAVVGGFAGLVRYLESDGEPGWTKGDGLYVDVDSSGTLNAGDVRLYAPTGFSCGTCPEGRLVVAGDGDRTEAADGDRDHPTTTTFATGAFELAWFDGDNDLAIGFQDVFYLKGPSAVTVGAGTTNTKHPDLNDVRLTESAKTLFTTSVEGFDEVSKSDQDYAYTYSVVTPGVAITNTADPDLKDQHLFLHFTDPDGTDGVIRKGDIQIYRAPTGGGGTLVTAAGTSATSPGHGTGIDTYSAGFAGRLRYYDESPTGTYSKNDPIYLKRPGNAAGTVEIGDIRITTAPPSFSAGTMVSTGDSDIGLALVADANLVVKRFNGDGDNTVKLNSLTNAKLADTLGATADVWDTGTEGIYLSADNVVSTGDTRLYHPTLASGTTTLVTCPGDADCPGGGSDAGALETYSSVRVTGPDATYDAGDSEYIYDSKDDKLGNPDVRVIAHPVGGGVASTVADADADVTDTFTETGDFIVVSHDPACATTCTPFVRVGDVFLYGSSFGTRVTESNTGFVPVLTQITTPMLVRNNRGEVGNAADDVFYTSITGSATLTTSDIRNSPITSSLAAGTLIKTIDDTFAEEVGGGAAFTVDNAALTTRICYIDVDGRTGLSLPDPAYFEFDTARFGAPFGATGTIHAYDVRITPYPASGTATYKGGTIILSGNNDLISGQTTCAAAPGGQAWFFRYFDLNRDGSFTGSGTAGTSSDDVAYVTLSTTLNNAPPPLHAIRITGSSGGTSSSGGSTSTGGSSGGGTTTPTNAAPVPRITCLATVGTNVIDVSGADSSDSDGTISSYSWSFGDGSGTSTLANPPAYTYQNPGNYTVSLTVSDGTTSRTASLTVEIPATKTDCSRSIVDTGGDGDGDTGGDTGDDMGGDDGGDTGDGDSGGDAGDNGTEDPDQRGTPGPAMPILVVLLAGLVLALRRRL